MSSNRLIGLSIWARRAARAAGASWRRGRRSRWRGRRSPIRGRSWPGCLALRATAREKPEPSGDAGSTHPALTVEKEKDLTQRAAEAQSARRRRQKAKAKIPTRKTGVWGTRKIRK